MVEKLKSILRPIPWSLAFRAFIFGVGWLLLPFWGFLLVALYFYFFPFFQPVKLSLHFIILIFFMATVPAALWLALWFSLVFYLLLGLKDFFFIDRKSAHEMLFLLFVFMLGSRFYLLFDTWSGITPIVGALFFGLLSFFLSKVFIGHAAASDDFSLPSRWRVSRFALSFLLCQFLLGILILPLNFLYQTALFFLLATVLTESILDYVYGTVTSRRLLANFSLFLIFVVIILSSASWNL